MKLRCCLECDSVVSLYHCMMQWLEADESLQVLWGEKVSILLVRFFCNLQSVDVVRGNNRVRNERHLR